MAKVGPVRRVRLSFDRTGRSEGRATANFETREDAQEAVRRFNGKKAAGLEIAVNLMDEPYSLYKRFPPGTSRYPDGENSLSGRLEPRSRRGHRGGGGTGARGDHFGRDSGSENRRPARPTKKTLEELDAELTSYMNGDVPSNSGTSNSNNSNFNDTNDHVNEGTSHNGNHTETEGTYSSTGTDNQEINEFAAALSSSTNNNNTENGADTKSRVADDDAEMMVD